MAIWATSARVAAVVVVAAIVIAQLARLSRKTVGDFTWHHLSGQRFLDGTFLYEGGINAPYPPFWAMAHATVAWMDSHLAQLLIFPLGLVAAALLFRILVRLTRNHGQLQPQMLFWVIMLALGLSARYWVRDLLECLANTATVMVAWLAIYLWSRRRVWLGGMSLGFAISLKCTPALFLPYFLLKRQWRMAIATVLFTALFTVMPILRYGPADYIRHMRWWAEFALLSIGEPNSFGYLSVPENMALRPTLARYLTRVPPGDPRRVDSPAYLDMLDLPPKVAGPVIHLIMFTLIAWIAWLFRSPVGARDDPLILWEFAAVSLLILLYSPTTWGQHCVGVIPAVFLISRLIARRKPLALWMRLLIGWYILATLVLNRELVGADGMALLESYRIETWAIVGLLAVVLGLHRSARRSTTSAPVADGADCGSRG